MSDRIRQGLEELADLAAALRGQAGRIEAIGRRYINTLRGGGTLFFAGNGGSAAHAQHVATEYLVRFGKPRRPFRAIALTTDSSVLTAAGNDLGFEEIFSRQIEALAGPRDLLILHSTSGTSRNLVVAVEAARKTGTGVVALLGRDGGVLAKMVDEALVIPSGETSRIQELHLAVEHLLVAMVEEELAG